MVLGFLRRLLQAAGGPCSAVIVRQQRCVSPAFKVASDTMELLTAVLHKLFSFSAPTLQQAAAWLNREVVVSHQALIPVIPASLGKLPQALSNAQGVQPSRWAKRVRVDAHKYLGEAPKTLTWQESSSRCNTKVRRILTRTPRLRPSSAESQLSPLFVLSTRFSAA